MKKCKNCKEDHDGSYGSGRFCGSKCTRRFSTKSKRKKINEKVSKKLKDESKPRSRYFKGVEIECKNCNKIFTGKNKYQQFCSKKCSGIFNGKRNIKFATKVFVKKVKDNTGWWSNLQKELYANGIQKVGGGKTKWYDYKDIRV